MEAKAIVENGPEKAAKLEGDIEFRNVSFNQPTRPKDRVLKNFSLNIKSKCMTAFVGDSGAGKSTIANLLMRSQDPSEGDILLDGKNMRDYNLKSLHSRMSIVSQSPTLFEDSILENIAYSRDDVTIDQIKKASSIANCDEFVHKFRTGWNTMVGSRGLQLSGGQRQRLAIARAALSDPDILILDEATSALDSKNEMLVKEALDKLMKDKTVIVIAHRLSTIRNADTIVCMRDGGIEEIGTHDELIEKKGFQQKLVEKQLESNKESESNT